MKQRERERGMSYSTVLSTKAVNSMHETLVKIISPSKSGHFGSTVWPNIRSNATTMVALRLILPETTSHGGIFSFFKWETCRDKTLQLSSNEEIFGIKEFKKVVGRVVVILGPCQNKDGINILDTVLTFCPYLQLFWSLSSSPGGKVSLVSKSWLCSGK